MKDSKYTDEWRKEASDFMKEYHSNNEHPMLGKHHTDEAKLKISLTHKGKILSEEHRQIISKTLKTPDEIEQLIITAYLNGDLIKDIAIGFEIAAKSIYRILDRNNIPRRSK